MLHGADQANCTEKYRRQTISNGERKGYPKEEPYARRKSGQEGGAGIFLTRLQTRMPHNQQREPRHQNV